MDDNNMKLDKYLGKYANDNSNEFYKKKINYYKNLVNSMSGGMDQKIADKVKIFEQQMKTNSETNTNKSTSNLISNPINNNNLKELDDLNKKRTANLKSVFDNINKIILDLNKCLCDEENKRKTEQKKVQVIEKHKNDQDAAITKMKDNVSTLQQDVTKLEQNVKSQSNVIKKLTEMVHSCSNIDVKQFVDLKQLCVSESCKTNSNIQKTYSELNKNITDFNLVNKNIQHVNITGGQPMRKFAFINL